MTAIPYRPAAGPIIARTWTRNRPGRCEIRPVAGTGRQGRPSTRVNGSRPVAGGR